VPASVGQEAAPASTVNAASARVVRRGARAPPTAAVRPPAPAARHQVTTANVRRANARAPVANPAAASVSEAPEEQV